MSAVSRHEEPSPTRRRAVAAWVSYDLANTIFSMGVISLFLPMWLREVLGAQSVDTALGLMAAVSCAIILVVSPLIGAMTDRAGRRMPFLVVSTLVCVAFTMLLARFGLALTVVFFIVANIAYQAGLQFYDALLPEVSTRANRGRIGGIGIGVGYFGSFLAVGLGFLLGTDDKPALFVAVGFLFLLFALPCFFFVKERPRPRREPVYSWTAIRESTRQTLHSLRHADEHPGLLRFLIGRVLYTDAINTVIIVMALFTINVAVATGSSAEDGERAAQQVLVFAIGFAVAGGFFWGWVADRAGPKRALNAVLWLWIVVFGLAAAIGLLALPIAYLYAVAALAGFALGGVWASDRPYMLRLSPPDRIGEFYGLYGMAGRFSAITGPASWALVFWFTVQVLGMEPLAGQAVGVLVLLVQIVIAQAILRKIPASASASSL